jgi:hypothetical protein
LGICYIGSVRNNPAEVIDLLGLPKLTFPIAGMTLGWPAQQENVKPRLPVQLALHWENYNRTTEDNELLAYDSTMINTGLYKGRQVPVPGKPEELEGYGWMEHSARRVSQAMRTGLRAALKKQGFSLR